MNIRIRTYQKSDWESVQALYEDVGWTNYTRNFSMLEAAYAHSLKILVAEVEGEVVGVIRVVGDGYSVVFLQDLIVGTDYQRRGIGRALVEQILSDYQQVYQIHLLTEHTEKTIAFYQSVGFRMASDDQCCAFSVYHIG